MVVNNKRLFYRGFVGGRGRRATMAKVRRLNGERIIPAVPFFRGMGLTLPGTGLDIPGSGLIVPGTGLIWPGTEIRQGAGFFQDVGKFFKKIVTSKPVKAIVKAGRKLLSPLVKKVVPFLIDSIPKLLAKTPLAALAPAASALGSLAKKPLSQLSDKGIDKLNALAEEKGFGLLDNVNLAFNGRPAKRKVKARDTPALSIAPTTKNLGKDNTYKALDKHALRLFEDKVVSAPIKGAGLLPL